MNEALLDAISVGDPVAVARALAGGADPGTDEDDLPAMLVAADTGEVDLVRPFLEAGHPVDTANEWGRTPLMCAVSVGRLPLVEFLVGEGADVNRGEHDITEASTVLTAAFELADPVPIVSVLLRAGADATDARPDGWTPLMLAAVRGSAPLVRALLTAGAAVDATMDDEGWTALHLAEYRRHDEVAAVLREHGARDPVDGCAARLEVIIADIAGWLGENAPPAHRELATHRGAADPAEVAALETALGQRLPVEVRAYLRHFGASGGLDIFEYAGLSVAGMLKTWQGLTTLRDEGAFHGNVPDESRDESMVRTEWWDPGWLPFAQDGGGNLYCVDLAPAEPQGSHGQVIGWEVHGGPCGPSAPSLERFLRNHRDKLLSGRYQYDEYSGTYANQPV